MIFKENLEDYTEAEFLELIYPLYTGDHGLKGKAREKHVIRLLLHIEKITEHPEQYGLLTHPPVEREDSPEGVVQEVKKWRAENGKPGFKPS